MSLTTDDHSGAVHRYLPLRSVSEGSTGNVLLIHSDKLHNKNQCFDKKLQRVAAYWLQPSLLLLVVQMDKDNSMLHRFPQHICRHR